MNKPILAPSILSADFANLARDIEMVHKAGAEYVHIDVMDGHFVPNLTLGAPVVKSIRKATDAVLDVHLMMTDPADFLEDFAAAGADIIGVHIEARGDTRALLQKIRALGKKACCVVKPNTMIAAVYPLLPDCDMVLVMTVEPGFGGQGLLDFCVDKVRALRREIDAQGYACRLEVDGGAKLDNTAMLLQAGADVIVAGSAVFSGDAAENTRAFCRLFEQVG